MLWIAVYESGVHATIARRHRRPAAAGGDGREASNIACTHGARSSSCRCSRSPTRASRWAAVRSTRAFSSTLTWAVIAGLVAGKLIGVSGATLAALRAGGTLPEGMPRRAAFGVAAAAGIGFTVSLFIADLAFERHPALVEQAKVGIFAGSLLAGLLGWAVLSRARRV